MDCATFSLAKRKTVIIQLNFGVNEPIDKIIKHPGKRNLCIFVRLPTSPRKSTGFRKVKLRTSSSIRVPRRKPPCQTNLESLKFSHLSNSLRKRRLPPRHVASYSSEKKILEKHGPGLVTGIPDRNNFSRVIIYRKLFFLSSSPEKFTGRNLY